MATPKNIELTDVEMQRLYINPLDENNDLLVQRDYKFVSTDPLADQISLRVFSTVQPWAGIPQNIKDALQTIDTWIYNQILADEGMT